MEKKDAKNVLLVDDQEYFLRMLASELRDSPYDFSVLTAENGKKALQILQTRPVAVVVSDLIMPVMDGYNLVTQMKRFYPHIPVIIMSAFLNPEAAEGLRKLGAWQCIDKTCIDELEQLIVKMGMMKGFLE